MGNVLGMLDTKDLISFSQNYAVNRNYKGNTLFNDIKTENFEAEMYRLSQLGSLSTVAKVHALDTEAAIGTRPTIEKVNVEKFLIKEKLNQSEKTRLMLNHGVDKSGLAKYVYDDLNTLGNAVLARVELMRMDLVQNGSITINENGLNFTIDGGVPSTNKVSYNWSSDAHDILGDIQTMVDLASAKGQIVNKVVTSRKIVRFMQKNKGIQAAINSALGVGAYVTDAQINTLMQQMFGFSIEIDEDMYATTTVSNGIVTRGSARFFADNKFVMMTTNNGSVGTGLWGITPEEESYGIGFEKSAKQFITFAQWETADPVALWSKASGMFVPALANPDGHVIATISFTE